MSLSGRASVFKPLSGNTSPDKLDEPQGDGSTEPKHHWKKTNMARKERDAKLMLDFHQLLAPCNYKVLVPLRITTNIFLAALAPSTEKLKASCLQSVANVLTKFMSVLSLEFQMGQLSRKLFFELCKV